MLPKQKCSFLLTVNSLIFYDLCYDMLVVPHEESRAPAYSLQTCKESTIGLKKSMIFAKTLLKKLNAVWF
jgi:hypothetical protein